VLLGGGGGILYVNVWIGTLFQPFRALSVYRSRIHERTISLKFLGTTYNLPVFKH